MKPSLPGHAQEPIPVVSRILSRPLRRPPSVTRPRCVRRQSYGISNSLAQIPRPRCGLRLSTLDVAGREVPIGDRLPVPDHHRVQVGAVLEADREGPAVAVGALRRAGHRPSARSGRPGERRRAAHMTQATVTPCRSGRDSGASMPSRRIRMPWMSSVSPSITLAVPTISDEFGPMTPAARRGLLRPGRPDRSTRRPAPPSNATIRSGTRTINAVHLEFAHARISDSHGAGPAS